MNQLEFALLTALKEHEEEKHRSIHAKKEGTKKFQITTRSHQCKNHNGSRLTYC